MTDIKKQLDKAMDEIKEEMIKDIFEVQTRIQDLSQANTNIEVVNLRN